LSKPLNWNNFNDGRDKNIAPDMDFICRVCEYRQIMTISLGRNTFFDLVKTPEF